MTAITQHFSLKLPEGEDAEITRGWLALAVSALALAGLFAIVLVFARTPVLQSLFPAADIFRITLIVHVNLSVLVWLLSICCLLWHTVSAGVNRTYSWTALLLATGGMLMIACSALYPGSTPLMNNYIPTITNPLFFMGLSAFGCGVLFQISLVLWKMFTSRINLKTGEGILTFGLYSIAIVTLVAFINFALAYVRVTKPAVYHFLEAELFYELLFWGGGHILQFTYTMAMALAWVWVASGIGLTKLPSKTLLWAGFGISMVLTLPTPLVYFVYDILSLNYTDIFTQHMRMVGGLLPILIAPVIVWAMLKQDTDKRFQAERNGLLVSMLLFGAGGAISMMIQGNDVTVPAHYHGSIVGISIGLMALVIHLLPRMGYTVHMHKTARLQPFFYGGGQLLHITGLAWSGGYGALRKTPEVMHSIQGQAAMGLMGLGGMLSIIGGLMFVIVVASAVCKARATKQTAAVSVPVKAAVQKAAPKKTTKKPAAKKKTRTAPKKKRNKR
ncbi:MAG: cytochrome C oxidase subunit I [Proteobacteria bacterium]|nr:cytochrome C oxidase subunit I [Pseudomonadota bacterium]